jgi:hypothetical protein
LIREIRFALPDGGQLAIQVFSAAGGGDFPFCNRAQLRPQRFALNASFVAMCGKLRTKLDLLLQLLVQPGSFVGQTAAFGGERLLFDKRRVQLSRRRRCLVGELFDALNHRAHFAAKLLVLAGEILVGGRRLLPYGGLSAVVGEDARMTGAGRPTADGIGMGWADVGGAVGEGARADTFCAAIGGVDSGTTISSSTGPTRRQSPRSIADSSTGRPLRTVSPAQRRTDNPLASFKIRQCNG